MAAAAKIVYGAVVAILSRDDRSAVFGVLPHTLAFFSVSEKAFNAVATTASLAYRF